MGFWFAIGTLIIIFFHFKDFFFKFLLMCMCECPQIPEESVGSSPAEITDGGEPLFVGAGN